MSEAAAGDRITETSYDDDPLLRVSRVIPPGHNDKTAVETRYGYWGAESGLGRAYRTVDDEKGIRTASVHDPYGRMVYTIADSAGTSAATGNNKTSFAYDTLDRLTSSTMPGGGRTTYTYDTLGRMTSKRYPDADGPVHYKYDDLGRARFSQDARQRALTPAKVTFTVYDDYGRVTSVGEAAADFSSLDPERSYPFERDSVSWRSRMYYDADSIASSPNSRASGLSNRASGPNYAQGRLSKVEENTDGDAAAEVVHRYAYDHLGNVRVKKVAIDGLPGEKTVEYVHDLAGRVSRLIYPDGSQTRYAYDGAGRLSRVWDAQGNSLASYTHTAAGNIATHVVGEGAGDGIATGTFTYNLREWVTKIDYPGRFTVEQQYDGVGNVTSQHYKRAASESPRVAAYSYDRLHRLTAFNLSGGPRRYYKYDRSGNLLELLTNSSYTLYRYENSSAPNRVSFVYGGGLFIRAAYNPNGWMTRMTRNALTYDYRGLLTGHGSAAYTMDPDRRRVKKTAGTAVTYYLRGADGSVLAEYDGSQALTARYVYAGARRIARVAAGSGTSYYLADHLGSTRSLIDEAGNVTAAYDYWPYGKVLASSGAESTHFRFTGHERDDESRLDYMLERSYAYDMGRFLRPDPMQDEYPGISPYVYAANNPLKFVDPDGLLVYFVNQKNGEIEKIHDRGGSEVDHFYVGTSRSEVKLENEPFVSVERGGGTIVSFRIGETEHGTKSGFIVPESGQKGYILEPPGPDTTMRDQNKRIPAGAYNLVRHRGTKHEDHFKLQNDKVPGDRFIVIHEGLTCGWSEGCLIIGSELNGYDIPSLDNSNKALEELNSHIKSRDHTKMKFYIFNAFPKKEED